MIRGNIELKEKSRGLESLVRERRNIDEGHIHSFKVY